MAGDKNKRKIYNLIMVVAVALIFFSSVMIAGTVKGWFDTGKIGVSEQGDRIIVKDKIGGANIERSGIAYSLAEDTRLKNGDIIETLNKASITFEFGENRVYINQNSKVLVHIKSDGDITLELKSGDIFAQGPKQIKLKLIDTDVTATNCVFSVSAPSGSARVSVFENSLQVGDKKIEAGYAADILTTGIERVALSIESLNEFNISNIRKINEVKELCFTNSDLDKLEAQRLAEIRVAKEEKINQEEKNQQIKEQQDKNKDKLNSTEDSKGNQSQGGNDSAVGGDSTGKPSTPSNAPDILQCTIEIRCDTILNNMDNLQEGKSSYVPANGKILSLSTIEFKEGETVFDVLKRACDLAGIQIEYSWTPMYNSYYIEGINNLYEFDCGNESGWMYKVNGWFPNYGCSSYIVQDNDSIVFCYTCKGLGADVGGGV